MKNDMKVSTVEFYVDKVRIRFKVIHNLQDVHGLSLEDAVNSWVVRTNEFTAISLCNYINEKKSGHLCVIPTRKNIIKYLGVGVTIN
jgi:hypothetical protein